MRLVLVDWLDSYGCSSSWQALEGCAPSLMVCHSVGWLLHDGEDCKVIVPHVSDGDGAPQQGCGDMTIPVKAIIRISELTASCEPDQQQAVTAGN